VLPEKIEPLKGKDAKRFMEYDRRQLTKSERQFLREAAEYYSKNKPAP
jgi:hypothetical protein